jgi:8-oxo-dGTP pyrophosphatase MutT (NUDIX family)
MKTGLQTFGFHQLPQGFAQNLDRPPVPPVEPEPAVTLALLRKGRTGLEVLLLRRSRRTRFIPGAWVFPGGRLDRDDGSPDLAARLRGLGGGDSPDSAFWSAAFRETFEETGILLHALPRATRPNQIAAGEAGNDLRLRVSQGQLAFGDFLKRLDVDLNAEALAYIGHWVTPPTEPIRFDTRFFATEIPEGCPVYPDGAELEDAAWLSPREALGRNEAGELPMAYPTLVTLMELRPFHTPSAAMHDLGNRPIPRLVPRMVREPGGIRFLLGD